jgi:UDP-N-acetyl-D-glucosamine dehydrogenase
MKVAIVGLGYVGLRTGDAVCARQGYGSRSRVDGTKVDLLNRGESYIKQIKQETIQTALEEERFCASTDFSRIKNVEAVIICVPTPLITSLGIFEAPTPWVRGKRSTTASS